MSEDDLTRAMEEHAEALRAVNVELKRQNDIAISRELRPFVPPWTTENVKDRQMTERYRPRQAWWAPWQLFRWLKR